MNDSEVRQLQTQLKSFQRRQRAERLPVAGLSSTAVKVLGAIARSGGCQPGQVVDELQMTTSNVAAALRELDAIDVVRRRKDTTDGRRVNVELTDAGRRLVDENRATRDSWLADAIDAVLDEDEQQILLAAGSLLARLARVEGLPSASRGR